MHVPVRRLLTASLACWVALSLMAGMTSAFEEQTVTHDGERLRAALDSMHVEELWLPGGRVAWKTGRPLDDGDSNGKRHTHCSAFVAAACARLNVYILRPPEHSTVLLANAQYRWLSREGRAEGWRPVGHPVEAQQLANQGLLVVATYKERGRRPGHIAIVRPCNKSIAAIEQDGPQIIQAGATNYRSTNLARGFRRHPAAWNDERVRFYCHELGGDALAE